MCREFKLTSFPMYVCTGWRAGIWHCDAGPPSL